MSTAINYTTQEDTTGTSIVNENYTLQYGGEGDDHSSTNNPVVIIRSPRKPKFTINTNNQIEEIKQILNGTVIECSELEMTARLEDITNPGNPDEMITLPLEEIESRDRSLIQPGALFLWHIGYRSGPKYPRERFSKICFRRLPKWTDDEIQDANKLSQEYANYLLDNH